MTAMFFDAKTLAHRQHSVIGCTIVMQQPSACDVWEDTFLHGSFLRAPFHFATSLLGHTKNSCSTVCNLHLKNFESFSPQLIRSKNTIFVISFCSAVRFHKALQKHYYLNSQLPSTLWMKSKEHGLNFFILYQS